MNMAVKSARKILFTKRDIVNMAATLYGEARNQPMAGMVAICHVILNRAKAQSWYGKNPEEVCRKAFQFSCWNKNDPNFNVCQSIADQGDGATLAWLEYKDFTRCLEAVLNVINGNSVDPTKGATHYFVTKMPQPPEWAKGKRPIVIIGDHSFYNNVE